MDYDGLIKSLSLPAGWEPPAEWEAKKIEPETEAALEVTLLFSDEPQMKKAVEELTEDEAKELLHTLFIRAKGGGDAAFMADVVKRCLLK